MILKPRLVVLDEPTSALDRSVQTGILALLEDLQEAHGLTYVLISHDLAVIRAAADEIAVMKDGRIVEQGPGARDCRASPRALYKGAHRGGVSNRRGMTGGPAMPSWSSDFAGFCRKTRYPMAANESGERYNETWRGQLRCFSMVKRSKSISKTGELPNCAFERGNEAVNKLDALTFGELRRALDAIKATPAIKGVLITSAKETFIVGADIFEFTHIFKQPETDIEAFVAGNSAIITALDDLPVPTVAAINGLALGGGFELALAADYRVMSNTAKIGFPEIYPRPVSRLWRHRPSAAPLGFGDKRRLDHFRRAAKPRRRALDGRGRCHRGAGRSCALAALALLRQGDRGRMPIGKGQRARLKQSLGIGREEAASLLAPAKAQAAKALPHLPAAHFAVDLLEQAAGLGRDAALALEAETFAKVAKTQAADSLVAIFINEQAVKKSHPPLCQGRAEGSQGRPSRAPASWAAASPIRAPSRGVPIVMKDISASALDLGMSEARKLLAKSVETGRLTQDKADAILASITPSLTYEGFDAADVVIEAVVEDIGVKHTVLREIEELTSPSTILASNTSSLLIGAPGGRPAATGKFSWHAFFQSRARKCRSSKSCAAPKHRRKRIAAVTGYAAAMGKTPIVVEDCPGFVVNRVLTPYLIAFLRLVHDGADFVAIDKAMEAFGWPMGPAYLIDVIGMDISHHVVEIVSAGFAPRMDVAFETAIEILLRAGRLGQKNGHGFYKYQTDSKGRPRKEIDPDTETPSRVRTAQWQDQLCRGGDRLAHDAALDP